MYPAVVPAVNWILEKLGMLYRFRTEQEKDRPRFRVDPSKGETAHSNIPAVVVKILSLGSLPLTIHEGQVFVQTGRYPAGIQHQKLSDTQISTSYPIEVEIPLPEKYVNSPGIREKSIQVVVDFSYGKNKERYRETKTVDIPNWY